MQKLDLRTNGFGIDAEITAKLTKNGTKISEVPIHYEKRGKSAGKKLRLQDGLVAAWTCFRYRFLEGQEKSRKTGFFLPKRFFT